MVTSYKTPDVYVEEISTFPPSVAEVATAIPAFIGATQVAQRLVANDLRNVPTKVYSLKEYESLFGFPHPEPIAITLTANGTSGFDSSMPSEPVTNFLLYYAVKMFFDNGGGQCYVVSTGDYSALPTLAELQGGPSMVGLEVVALEDEPTLIVIPEAVKLSTTDYATLVQAVLKQCGDLGDRFGIFDVQAGTTNLTTLDSTPRAPHSARRT